MFDMRLVEVFANGDPEVPTTLVMHRVGAPAYDHAPLTMAETIEAVLALLRSLPQEDRERGVAAAVSELADFKGERLLAGLRRAPAPPQ